jgi:hypothetical protein
MLMRYGQAALLAAVATLMGMTVWAQDYIYSLKPADCCQKAKSCNNKGCCATGACSKDGKAGCISYTFEIVESDGKCVGLIGTCCKDGKCVGAPVTGSKPLVGATMPKQNCGECPFGCAASSWFFDWAVGLQLASNDKSCCATGACSKDGKCVGAPITGSKPLVGACCKDGECCCQNKKCDAKCTCCKDNKCECGKGGECCCKDGKCSCKDKSTCCCKDATCCKDKTVTKMSCDCPFLNQLAKNTAIIMVMPASLPLLGACHPGAMGMLPRPPMPMGPQVMLPGPMGPVPPPPPMLTPPGLPVPTMVSPCMPPHNVAMPVPPPVAYCPSTAMPMPCSPPTVACCPCPTAMPMPCPPTPDYIAKTNPQIESCMQMLGVASDLCSLMRPLSPPTACAAALDLLMEMCPITTCPMQLPAPMYVTHPPQYIPAPPMMAPCEVSEVNVETVNRGGAKVGVGVYSNTGRTGSMIVAGPNGIVAAGPPVDVAYGIPVAAPASAAKVRIIAIPDSSELEMNVGDDTCIRCKKMTVKIGDNEISVSRFDNRVRVRGEELKATADSVRSDRKDRIILEGDVVLHYKKDGHSANVTGDRIEVNLSSGAVTIKPAEKPLTRPTIRIDRIDINEK